MQPEPIETIPNISKKRFSFVPFKNKIESVTPIDWVIKPLIESDSLALVYGPPESCKTLFVLDAGVCCAAGMDFHGCKTKQGAVFYIGAEGSNGQARRQKALEIHKALDDPDIPFYTSERSAAFFDYESAHEVSESIERTVQDQGLEPALIIIDTLSRNFGPANENSTEDMARFIDNIDHFIREKFKATVVIVHHTGQGDKSRARGSSVLKAAVDAEYRMEKAHDGVITLESTKMKDAAHPDPMAFELVQVDLPWADEDGYPVNSVVLEQTECRQPKSNHQGLGRKQAALLELLVILYEEHQEKIDSGGLNSKARVSKSELQHEAANREVETDRSNFYKNVKKLKERSLIREENGFLFLEDQG